jgi:hypothetical protein
VPRTLQVALLAAGHFGVTMALGVLTFIAQGNLTDPTPSARHEVLSAATSVLEFPLVWLVRWLDPEALRAFTAAAVCNSLMWGTALYAVIRRR